MAKKITFTPAMIDALCEGNHDIGPALAVTRNRKNAMGGNIKLDSNLPATAIKYLRKVIRFAEPAPFTSRCFSRCSASALVSKFGNLFFLCRVTRRSSPTPLHSLHSILGAAMAQGKRL
ncbi:hypothetical protein [Novosphingobium sp. KACC 22771]|uniref:hypothetical protein n=1 Tax=Novosphingobium sp. KACC 22771 TaxID=3025670 RepID=UPI0023652EAD|nr:hypothetical protein [Novosphingobium sp. KACC 22771]WDF74382.1 hypothetical protein PQ467_20745 [Novosphingobium sp. KACC 22771]